MFACNQISFVLQVPEESPIGTVIARLRAVDVDSPANAIIAYSLFPNFNEQLPFAINATTGELYVSSRLHYDSTTAYIFQVLASNRAFTNQNDFGEENARSSGISTLEKLEHKEYSSTVLVEIFVQSSSNADPNFSTEEQNFDISRTALKGIKFN